MGNETGGKSQISLQNVLVSNVIAQSRFGSYVGGCLQKRAENVTLSNVRLILTGDMPENASLTGSGVWSGLNPYALYCSQVNGLRIKDVDFDFRKAQGAWRYSVFCEEVRDAEFHAIRTQGFAVLRGQAVIGLTKTTAAIRNSDAEPQVPTFLHAVEGSRVLVSGCDLSRARKTVTVDEGSNVVTSAVWPPSQP